MDDLVRDKFFGLIVEKFCAEIHAVGYNEYLKAVTVLKETLMEEFPEKKEAVERGCGEMLKKFSEEFENIWFNKFFSLCKSNVFEVPPEVTVYDPELEKVEENQKAQETCVNLQQTIMASKYLNLQLVERIKKMDDEITERKALLAKLASTEELIEIVKKGELLQQKICAFVQLPEHVPET